MRQAIATGATSIAHLFTGDSRLKRVAVKIKAPKLGDREFTGHALVNELSEKMFSFFCTEKFSIDEELEIQMRFSGHDLTYRVTMSHLHEQISSGRIMNALPSEDNPFPARKFYRCFSKVLELKGMERTEDPGNQDAKETAGTVLKGNTAQEPKAA
jgi:hypothetical protein